MIGLIVALIAGLTLWKPKFGLAALILAWPSYLLRLSIAGIPTTALELGLYAAAAMVILNLLLKRIPWNWPAMSRTTWFLLALWIMAWAVSAAFAKDSEAALGAIKAWLVDPLLFVALLTIVIQTPSDRRYILQAAIVSGTIVALAGLIQLAGFRETLQEGRLSSFFAPVANYASMYLGPLVAMTFALLITRYLRSWLWWLSFLVMSAATLLTLSFGAFAAVAVAGFFIWLMLPRGALKRGLLIGGISVVALGTFALSQTPNFKQHFDFTDRSSGLVRTQIWVTSWSLIQQQPIVGIGPNNFEDAYRDELPKHYFPPLEWLVAQPHNLYLALWLETGLLGLLTFLALFVHHLKITWKKFFPDPSQRAVAVASLAGLIAILVHGLVDTPYFKNDLAMEFMFLAILPWLGQAKALGAAKNEFISA